VILAAAFEYAAPVQRISCSGSRTCDKWRVKSSLTAGSFEKDGSLRTFLALWKILAHHPRSKKQRGIP
jgi:hypothetical protein